MTQQSTPGGTPPPSWTPDSAVPVALPAHPQPAPIAPAPALAPTSFAPAPVVATVAPRKNRASTGTALLLVGALVAIGGVAFAVGRVTAPPAATAATGFGGRGTGTGGTGLGGVTGTGTGTGGFGRGGAGGGVSISGTVVSIDATSIQIKLASGTTETLNLGGSVTYRNATAGSAADVTPGATVEIGLALGGGRTGPTASGNPRPSGGFGGGFTGTVGTITVVK